MDQFVGFGFHPTEEEIISYFFERKRKMAEFVGFGFHPTEEQIISYFLERKMRGLDFPVHTITEVDICKFEPWDLPQLSPIPPDDQLWYFFNAPAYKYVRGKPTMERTTATGFWKFTGKVREIWDKQRNKKIGFKKNLVFYEGRAPNGIRTNWVMHEYHSNNASCYPKEYILFRLKRKSGHTSAACNEANRHLASNPGIDVASALQVNHDLSEELRLPLENNPLDRYSLSALFSTLQPVQGTSYHSGAAIECNSSNSYFNATDQDNAFVDSLWAEQDEYSGQRSVRTLLHGSNPSKPLTGVYVGDSSDTDAEFVHGQAQTLEIESLFDGNASSKLSWHRPMVPVFYGTSSSSDGECYKGENGFFDEIVNSDMDMSEIDFVELVVDEFPPNTRASKSQYIPKSHSFIEKKYAPPEPHLQSKALHEAVSKMMARETAVHAIALPKTESSIAKFDKDKKMVQTSDTKTGLKFRSDEGDSSNRKGSSIFLETAPLDHKNYPPSVYVSNVLFSFLLILFFVREMMYLH